MSATAASSVDAQTDCQAFQGVLPLRVHRNAHLCRQCRCGGDPLRRTTEQAFGKQPHLYTIADAINDGNALPFQIDYQKFSDPA